MTTPGLKVDGLSRPVVAFLRDALSSSPSRWRNTLRLTFLCCLATVVVMALHIPNGEFLMIFFFSVSLPDAWASLRKARLRGIGTIIGGLLAVLCILAFGDKPWLWVVVQGFLFAVALFLMRTTTVPYAIILAIFTFVIATPVVDTNPDLSLETVFWRILLTLVGAVIGTLAQLYLWPDRPRAVLLRELASRLRKAEEILADVSAGRVRSRGAIYGSDLSTGTVNQLDFLASAEAGSPWVRERHAQHLKLVTDVEAILVSASRLEELAALLPVAVDWRSQVQLSRAMRSIAGLCAVIQGHPANDLQTEPGFEAGGQTSAVLSELERVVREAEGSIPFLMLPEGKRATEGTAARSAVNAGAGSAIFTPACNLSNIEAVQFGLKGALAASICYVIYQALNWPGISACVVTTLIVAQSSFGAGLQKSLMRLLGALLGGVMSAIAILGLVPNMDSLASFVVVVGALYFVAAWITTGNARVSYVGLQVSLVLSLVLLNTPGPTINLTPAIDRVIGVLIGIAVMGFIDLALWPSFAGTALVRKLALTQAALADLARCAFRRDWDKADEAALVVRRRLAVALSLYNEAGLEFGSHHARDANRSQFLAIAHRLEETFLALMMRNRFRRNLDESKFPEVWRHHAEAFDDSVARRLETLAKAPAKTVPGTSAPTDWNIAEPSVNELLAEDALLRQELAASLSRLGREVRQSTTEANLKIARPLAVGTST